MIISVILFSVVRKENNISQLETTEMNCSLNDEEYTIQIKSLDNKIIELGGDTKLQNILELDKLEYSDQVIDKITNYIETNGGNCN